MTQPLLSTAEVIGRCRCGSLSRYAMIIVMTRRFGQTRQRCVSYTDQDLNRLKAQIYQNL